ncbi:hypothetical protein [uncultured Rhodoblastus sp.]|uniref:hypothetical protein n=1 Tax=uncultured Rhodoblastus sp. TaxID=543037 RepID=UPI0025ECE9AF|nr:hypothetical protein [uncultured Rhodoblastus sp.]
MASGKIHGICFDIEALGAIPSDDHALWSAALKCCTIHSKLVGEVEFGVDNLDPASIDTLATERGRAVTDLAEMRSCGIDGIILKKVILMSVAGGYDETALLLRSCLSDCDRVIESQSEVNLIDIEPELSTLIANFFQPVNQLVKESDRFADVSIAGAESDLRESCRVIKDLGAQIEAAMDAVAKHPATTFAGLNAKLEIFEMSDGCRGNGHALLSLRGSMFRDFDRLLEPLKKPVLPCSEKICSEP